MIIYCIEYDNVIVYVGQTQRTLSERIEGHKRSMTSCDTILSKAFRKYGFDNFIFYVFHDDIDNIYFLNKYEEFYIGYYNTYPPSSFSYNMTTGGEGYIVCDEYKKKLSDSQKKRWTNEERQRHGCIMKNVHKNDITISEKQSNSQKERYKKQSERDKTSIQVKKGYIENPDRIETQRRNTRQRYIDNPELRIKQSILSKTDKRYIEGRKKAHESRRKKVKCIELNIIFNSIKECADYFGIKYPYISKVIKHNKKYKGLTLTTEV